MARRVKWKKLKPPTWSCTFSFSPRPISWQPWNVFLNIKLTQSIIISCIIISLYVFHLNKSIFNAIYVLFSDFVPFLCLEIEIIEHNEHNPEPHHYVVLLTLCLCGLIFPCAPGKSYSLYWIAWKIFFVVTFTNMVALLAPSMVLRAPPWYTNPSLLLQPLYILLLPATLDVIILLFIGYL